MTARREQTVRLWFDMWLQGRDLGMDEIFAPDCVYTESWGPQYNGRGQVRHWFDEWNTRGRVLVWDIKRFLHSESHTAVEWYFRCAMHDGLQECFDGVSLIQWDGEGRIYTLTEYGCKLPHYDPYEKGPAPDLRNTGMWV